jgi:spore maturation protein CgeB
MKPTIAFFGANLVSEYRNGVAAYQRGIIRALSGLGYDVTVYEPDAADRDDSHDVDDHGWARVVVYAGRGKASHDGARRALQQARHADVIIKTSGVGVFDAFLNEAVLGAKAPHAEVIFWDVDPPATLDRLAVNRADPFRALLPRFDLVLTCGGGEPVVRAYESVGARRCSVIYHALDPTTHFAVPSDPRFEADLGFLGNRLPDREGRVDQFFFTAAVRSPESRFLLGGGGWSDKSMPANVSYVGHVPTRNHNAFNCTPRAVLNISRDSSAHFGFSPPARLFEAAGAGACLITDAWEGIEMFLEPGREVLVAADGDQVAALVELLDPERAATIGRAARKRICAEHTYAHRAAQLDVLLGDRVTAS